MKDHAKLFSICKSFHAKIQNQFSSSIHTFYSDNDLEYLLLILLASAVYDSLKGILSIHPQRNGVVERKNMHLLDTTRTLLIQYHVPLHFGAMQFSCLAI